jgi:hypothetical protein
MANESIERFLRAEGRGLDVPRESELTLDAGREELGRDAHRLEIRSFDDLRSLRLVVPEVREDSVREAIAADDEAAWQESFRLADAGRTDCACHERTETESSIAPQRGGAARSVEAAYRGLRRRRHPSLARLVGAEIKNRVTSDSLVVKAVYGWTDRLMVAKVIDLIAFKYKDVTIAHNATLSLAPAVNIFYCGDLRIHVGGRLRIKGSYIKVNCLSAQGNLA